MRCGNSISLRIYNQETFLTQTFGHIHVHVLVGRVGVWAYTSYAAVSVMRLFLLADTTTPTILVEVFLS